LNMFYPTHFTNYVDSLSTFLTCPRCKTISKCSTPWNAVKDGWGYDELETHRLRKGTIAARAELTCPSCGTRVTLYLAGGAGGRQGEVQYDVAAAKWNGITVTEDLASKPPVHLFPDAPKELPRLRGYACVAELWYDHTWWEVNVPEQWTHERKDMHVFECSYGGELRVGVGKTPSEADLASFLGGAAHATMSGYERGDVPPEITSPEERAAYSRARRLWEAPVPLDERLLLMIPALVRLGPRALAAMGSAVIGRLLGGGAKLTRYQLGSLVGYWGVADKDGMSEGKGAFGSGPWSLHVYLSCPTKNYEYCWGASQIILGSIRFYPAAGTENVA
jgi:hypothetical protein